MLFSTIVEIQAINWFVVRVQKGGIERREKDSLCNEEAEVLLLRKISAGGFD